MKKTTFPAIIVLLLSCTALISCAGNRAEYTKTEIALGTFVQINIISAKSESEKAEQSLALAFKKIEEYENIFDHRHESGKLYAFNNSTLIRNENNDLLFSLLKESIFLAKKTGGYFDPTVLPIVQLYGFDTDNPSFPGDDKIREALKNVGYEKVTVYDDRIEKPLNVKFDLGGIAKGKIVDLIRDLLKHTGYTDFLINAGGDLYVSGLNRDKKKWKIAIQDPVKQNSYNAIIEKSNTAIVTSGDYERFFVEDGIRYSHLFNPKTGYPFSDCKSVTILAEDTAFADAIATAVFTMGSSAGYAFLTENHISGYIIYTDDEGKIATKNTPDFWD
jgi:thiamine biosynthesis lipoprotein